MTALNCDPEFLSLLEGFELRGLEQDPGTIFGLWPDLRLAYVNPAWTRFAAENGGEPDISRDWGLGASIASAIAEPLRPFFLECYGRCLAEARPWVHIYECSSPNLYRTFQMKAFPMRESRGILVVNALHVEMPMHRVSQPPDEQRYRNEHGLIVQCAHCRRVHRLDGRWDWVAEWVASPPPRTSHGICGVCVSYYYTIRRGMFRPPFSTTGNE
ncbi:MAG TPA: hypothetical protein VHB77_01415 [Planctomycetaceae bacterium]|nr:hypothetical protein [Planctomycetaceae bacterium]